MISCVALKGKHHREASTATYFFSCSFFKGNKSQPNRKIVLIFKSLSSSQRKFKVKEKISHLMKKCFTKNPEGETHQFTRVRSNKRIAFLPPLTRLLSRGGFAMKIIHSNYIRMSKSCLCKNHKIKWLFQFPMMLETLELLAYGKTAPFPRGFPLW